IYRATRICEKPTATTGTWPASPPGTPVGAGIRRTLCGGLSRLLRLPVRVCAVDGRETLALRGPDCRSTLSVNRHQHAAVRRLRRERKDVPGAAALRFLPAPSLVDQGSAGRLRSALADCGGASLHLLSLDAATAGFD